MIQVVPNPNRALLEIKSTIEQEGIHRNIVNEIHINEGGLTAQGKIQNPKIIPNIGKVGVANCKMEIWFDNIHSFKNVFMKARNFRLRNVTQNTPIMIFVKKNRNSRS